MNPLETFTIRHYQPDDYPALADLINTANHALGIQHRITAEELSAIVEVPGFDRDRDSFIVEDAGRIVAMSNQGYTLSGERCWADAVVHPDYQRRGIGTELLRLTEARCREWAALASPDEGVVVQLATHGVNLRAQRLFEAHGYQYVRTFYAMRIELGQPVDAPPLPAGLTLRPFEMERDAHVVYEADMDAFADHWGFERDSYDDWEHRVIHHPQNDFSLWLIAYYGDEIAGICLNRAGEGDDPHMAWVSLLGVRRPWRGRGLGGALLKMSFARFQSRGLERAGLMVDASNATNAVALYERAGMHVHASRLVYHKRLRAGATDHA